MRKKRGSLRKGVWRASEHMRDKKEWRITGNEGYIWLWLTAVGQEEKGKNKASHFT